jgi:hypothetical protein
MTRSPTVAAVPALAAEGFARQVSEPVLLALRVVAWPTVGRPIVALLGAVGILIAERRSVPQP